jgi:hypothetical protein
MLVPSVAEAARIEQRAPSEHDPEKWTPVSRLREALARLVVLA